MSNKDLEKARKIERQVERWDLFAKLAPTFFLLGCFAFLAMGMSFEVLFNIGMVAFGITAVTWWFWTIYSIRHLVRIFRRATENLMDVGEELKAVKKEYRELRDEENSRR
jgi:membrane protein YdbS with pleckstrin-like domain